VTASKFEACAVTNFTQRDQVLRNASLAAAGHTSRQSRPALAKIW
jgi:hypothetical protein